MVLVDDVFVTSLSLQAHPLCTVKDSIKVQYFDALAYLITNLGGNWPKTYALRLKQYREFLLGKDALFSSDTEKSLRAVVDCRLRPWRKMYRHMLLCDIALITQAGSAVLAATNFMKKRIPSRQHQTLDDTINALRGGCSDFSRVPYIESMAKQYYTNKAFLMGPVRRIMIAANMSAGKSTLINALIGKRIARTSMEACTGNVCYIYNKPFEDGRTHLSTSVTDLDATPEELTKFDWNFAPSIATYFRTPLSEKMRLCIIDTPGVNSALNKAHGNIAREALKNETYIASSWAPWTLDKK